MRIIVNIPSERMFCATKWRARAIEVNEKSEAVLKEVLQAVFLSDGVSLYNLLVTENQIMNDWILYVNGVRLPGNSGTEIRVKDNSQIHIMDNPQLVAGKSSSLG